MCVFLIESERSRHKLFVDRREAATFSTLGAAEAEANRVANQVVPGSILKFDLDLKWTLTDLEIRVATLEREIEAERYEDIVFEFATPHSRGR
jgi:hypothetical protein